MRLLQNRQLPIAVGDEETAQRGALRSDALEFSSELRRGHSAVQRRVPSADHVADLLGGFACKFEAEMADAGALPRIQRCAGLLSFGSEDGVAATDVHDHGMRAASRVFQMNLVAFAGTAAIAIAGSGR